MSDLIGLLISAPALTLVAIWVTVEAYCVVTNRPTISRRIQRAALRNPQIACFAAAVAGWLLAHFTGPVGRMRHLSRSVPPPLLTHFEEPASARPDRLRGVVVLATGVVVLIIVQTLDGLTLEHVRILSLGVALGLVLAGTLEATVIPLAVSLLRATQRWRSDAQ
jgi:hypothetical protein